MRKTRPHIIFKYHKRRRGKIVKGKYISLPLPFIILFFVFAVLSVIFFNSFSTNNMREHLTYSPVIPTLQALHKDLKGANSSFKFPFLASVLSSKSASLSPTSKPHKFVETVSAQEQNQSVNDYCLNVPVLLYHHIQPYSDAQKLGHAQLTVDSAYFDSQMAYLATNNYHVISADELSNALREHHSLPAKSIVISIDDGYDDNYEYAFQILKKYNLTGNFMIPTGLIGNNGYMTWEQLKEISGNSLMRVYNHTFSHAYLDGAGKDKIEYEISTAQSQLESNLGNVSKIFTYPYGSFNQLVIEVLKQQGFTAAFSTIGGTMQCESYIFTLRRLHIGNAPLSSYGL